MSYELLHLRSETSYAHPLFEPSDEQVFSADSTHDRGGNAPDFSARLVLTRTDARGAALVGAPFSERFIRGG
jgi:hypothetical protein